MKNHSYTQPHVAVIILNWNGKKDTLECLDSLRKLEYSNYEIVVVDNASSDGSAESISNFFPGITLLQTGENIGYAGGNNIGIRWALENDAEFILILNNDTVIHPELVTHLISAAQLDAEVGLLGPTNYYYNNPTTIWAVGAMMGSPPNCEYRVIGDGDQDASWKESEEFDAIVGSAILIRKNVFEKIGFFDERFFLCYEEFDLCARARKIKYKCLFVPEAKIWHKVGVSLGENKSPLRIYFNTRNRMLWSKKHLSWLIRFRLLKNNARFLYRLLLPPLILIETGHPFHKKILWSFSSWIKTIKRNINNPNNKAKLFGLRDYYLGRFGDCPDVVRSLGRSISTQTKSNRG